MNRIIIFEDSSVVGIEKEVNDFARTHEIVGTSIASVKYGSSTYYTVVVTYKL